jgi:hypothetical protein
MASRQRKPTKQALRIPTASSRRVSPRWDGAETDVADIVAADIEEWGSRASTLASAVTQIHPKYKLNGRRTNQISAADGRRIFRVLWYIEAATNTNRNNTRVDIRGCRSPKVIHTIERVQVSRKRTGMGVTEKGSRLGRSNG